MPRFIAASAPAAKPSYGSGFDGVALRDSLADFDAFWGRRCLLTEGRPQAGKQGALAMAA